MELSKNRDRRARRMKQKQRHRRRSNETRDLHSTKYRQRVRSDKTILLEEKKRLEEELNEYYEENVCPKCFAKNNYELFLDGLAKICKKCGYQDFT